LSSLTLAGKEPQRDSRNSHERLEVKAIASQYEEVVSYFCYRHARGKSDDPREELIIRYQPSRGEQVAPVTKNERQRESEVKETGKETN